MSFLLDPPMLFITGVSSCFMQIFSAVGSIGGMKNFVKSKDKVLIKVNICGGVPELKGTYTTKEVAGVVVDMVREVNHLSAVEVKVIPPNASIIQGKKLDLNISVDPSGTAIAGAQLKIEFDNSLTTTINVYGAILGPFNVSTPDAFVVINVTPRNLIGEVFVNLSDVKICDPSGNYVAIEVFNGSLNIMEISPYNASQSLFINGTVVDSITRAGISGVTVFSNTSGSTTTDASGYYSLAVAEGTHDLTYLFDPIYYANINTASITSGSVTIPDIELVKKPTGTITGMVSND